MLFLAGKYLHPLELCGVGVFVQCEHCIDNDRGMFIWASQVSATLVSKEHQHTQKPQHGQGQGHNQLLPLFSLQQAHNRTIEIDVRP